VGVSIFFKIPERLGIIKSPTEQLLSQTPDPDAAKKLTEELKKTGISTQGLKVYVIPYKGREGSLAFAVLNASEGFNLQNSGNDVIMNSMKLLAVSNAAKQNHIQRVAVDYRNKDGKSLITLTASTEAISSFALGKINQEQFMKEVEGMFNLPELIKEAKEVLK